jgi:hypothetical protein
MRIFDLLALRRGSGPPGFPDGLTGVYRVESNGISGRVWKIPYFRNGIIRVQAWRGMDLVKECNLPDIKGNWRPFTMEFGSDFNAEGLAQERIIVTARNERNDTGTLVMDGADRLELIRRYMGRPADVIFDLDLRRSGNARPFLGKGWSGAEDEFTWAIDDESLVNFPSPACKGAYLLRMRYSTYITEFVPQQVLELYVNDIFIESFVETSRNPSYRQFRIDSNCFNVQARSLICLRHSKGARPDEHTGFTDSRRLSFRFYNISLVYLLE